MKVKVELYTIEDSILNTLVSNVFNGLAYSADFSDPLIYVLSFDERLTYSNITTGRISASRFTEVFSPELLLAILNNVCLALNDINFRNGWATAEWRVANDFIENPSIHELVNLFLWHRVDESVHDWSDIYFDIKRWEESL